MRQLNKFELWILMILSLILTAIVYLSITLSPYAIINGNTDTLMLFESAIKLHMIFPLILTYGISIGFLIFLIKSYRSK